MSIRWQDWINALLGCWLAVSPTQMEYTLNHVATGNAYGVGAVLILFNISAVVRLFDAGQEIVNILIGIWLILSPYALGYAAERTPALNAISVGVLVIVFAGWQIADAVKARRR
jgi:hypothetical protein